jgi:hypothetical protein
MVAGCIPNVVLFWACVVFFGTLGVCVILEWYRG